MTVLSPNNDTTSAVEDYFMQIRSYLINDNATLRRRNRKLARRLAVARWRDGAVAAWSYMLVWFAVGMIVGWCACKYKMGI